MKKTLLLLIMVSAGCQGLALTERYQDRIDRISDREGRFDRFYVPAWDLTRFHRDRLPPPPCPQCFATPVGSYATAPTGPESIDAPIEPLALPPEAQPNTATGDDGVPYLAD